MTGYSNNPMIGTFGGYNPMAGFGGGYNPMLGIPQGAGGDFNPILAQILKSLEATQAADQQRLAERSQSFDPSANYNTGGAPPPYFMGMSAMQRWRDMQMRQEAQRESAKAAVQAVQQQQASLPAPGSQEERDAALAASGTVKEAGRSFDALGNTTQEYTNLINPKYGTGTNMPLPAGVPKSMHIGPVGGAPLTGGDLREFFQRASNAQSPNAGVGSLPAPQPGYPGGGPVSAAEDKLWAMAMKGKKKAA